jgi:hypothetical protein
MYVYVCSIKTLSREDRRCYLIFANSLPAVSISRNSERTCSHRHGLLCFSEPLDMHSNRALFVFFSACLYVFVDSRPVQLVAPDATHQRLEIVDSSLQLLQTIPSPVSVVSVIGSIHSGACSSRVSFTAVHIRNTLDYVLSGKSFLLNRLLNQTANGFELGHTVDPKTQGIWMWYPPPVVSNQKGDQPPVALIFVDTEGLYAGNVSRLSFLCTIFGCSDVWVYCNTGNRVV